MNPASVISLKKGSPLRRLHDAVRARTIEPARRMAGGVRRRLSDKTFIGITGSSGKTSTTTILRHILDGGASSWGLRRGANGIGDIRRALLSYPRTATHIVMEVGAGEKDALDKSGRMLAPHLSIITMVRMEHYSHFRAIEAVAQEKGWLAHHTRPDGVVIANGDDPLAMQAARRSRARIATFGQSEGADYRASEISAGYPDGLALTISWRGEKQRIATPFVAEHFWVPVTAAFAAAIELGVNPREAAARIATCPQIRHRMNVVEIPGGPVFLMDTAKAPYHSIFLAIGTVAQARAAHKRIVIGTISDYPGNPKSKYRKTYEASRAAADEVIFINDRMHRSGASAEDIASGRYKGFSSTEALFRHLRETAVPGELILLKGSRNDHLERIVLAFQEDVRCWRDRCGIRLDCHTCGLFKVPFQDHGPILRQQRRARRWGFLSRLLRPRAHS